MASMSPADLQQRGETTLAVEGEAGAEGGCSLASVKQSITLFLFLHHMDPFTSDLSDVIGEGQLPLQPPAQPLLPGVSPSKENP